MGPFLLILSAASNANLKLGGLEKWKRQGKNAIFKSQPLGMLRLSSPRHSMQHVPPSLLNHSILSFNLSLVPLIPLLFSRMFLSPRVGIGLRQLNEIELFMSQLKPIWLNSVGLPFTSREILVPVANLSSTATGPHRVAYSMLKKPPCFSMDLRSFLVYIPFHPEVFHCFSNSQEWKISRLTCFLSIYFTSCVTKLF